MKKGRKRILAALSALLFAFAAAGLFACAKQPEISDFSVVDEVTVEIGSIYNVPAAVAIDENGTEYEATYTVKQGETAVDVSQNKFTVLSLEGYEIVYTVTVGDKTYTAETQINVTDTVAPTVYFRETSVRVPVGEASELPQYTVQDYSPISQKTITAHYMNDATGVTVEGDSFTPDREGFYRIDIVAQDAQGNEGTGSAILFAYEEKNPAVLEDVFEDFSSGYDPEQIYCASGQVTLAPVIRGEKVSVQANTNGNWWPTVMLSASWLEAYVRVYDEVLLTINNEGAYQHQIYYQTAGEYDGQGNLVPGTDAYNRVVIPGGQKGEVVFTEETVAWALANEKDIELVIMNDPNDGNNEMFSVYFEELRGRFGETQTIYAGDTVQIPSVYADVEKLAGKNYAGFEVYFEGEKTTEGVLENSFSPLQAGMYEVRILFGEDGYAVFEYDARNRQASLQEGFENATDTSMYTASDIASMQIGDSQFAPEGANAMIVNYTTANSWPVFVIDRVFLSQIADVYEFISLKIYNGGQYRHQFYVEDSTGNALRRYEVEPGMTATIVIWSGDLQTILNAGKNLRVVMFNDDSPSGTRETAFFLVDDIYGGFSGVNARENTEIKLGHIFGEGLFNLFDEYEIRIFDASGNEVQNAVSTQKTVTLSAGEYTAVMTTTKEFYTDGTYTASLHIRDAAYQLIYGFEDGVAGSEYGVEIGTADLTKTYVKVSSAAEGASEGSKSLAFDFDGVNDGYPYMIIKNSVLKDFYYLYGEMHFDLYNAGGKTHECYFEYQSGQYVRNNLTPAARVTVSLNAEQLLSLIESGKDLRYEIGNAAGTDAYEGARFTIYLDNIRGAK